LAPRSLHAKWPHRIDEKIIDRDGDTNDDGRDETEEKQKGIVSLAGAKFGVKRGTGDADGRQCGTTFESVC